MIVQPDKPITVYRVETKKGNGPHNGPEAPGFDYEYLTDESAPMVRKPTVLSESEEAYDKWRQFRKAGEKTRFAFTDLAWLRLYFSPPEMRLLKRSGFAVQRYKVRTSCCVTTPTQAVYIKTAARKVGKPIPLNSGMVAQGDLFTDFWREKDGNGDSASRF